MLICDTHADTLYALQRGVLETDITHERLTQNPTDVRVQALALFTGEGGLADDPNLIQRELDVFAGLKAAGFHQITRLTDALPGIPNVLLTTEGGEVYSSGVDTVDAFYALGVRMAGLVWNNPCELAYPASGDDAWGLTDYGKQVVRRMHSLGMAVDISHLNPRGVMDLLDMGGAAPLASHSCVHALCPHPRNLTDDQLRALLAAGGFIGVNFYSVFLSPDGIATLDTVIDHLAYICDMGGKQQVGLGSDFDGIDRYPQGLRHAGDVHALLDRLRQRGFGEKLTHGIAGENFRRYFERVQR